MTTRAYRKRYYVVCYVDGEDRKNDGLCCGTNLYTSETDAIAEAETWSDNCVSNPPGSSYEVVEVRLTKEEAQQIRQELDKDDW